MLRKAIELPPHVAQAFGPGHAIIFKPRDQLKRDEIASRQLVREFLSRRRRANEVKDI